jgi:hypothetical protein
MSIPRILYRYIDSTTLIILIQIWIGWSLFQKAETIPRPKRTPWIKLTRLCGCGLPVIDQQFSHIAKHFSFRTFFGSLEANCEHMIIYFNGHWWKSMFSFLELEKLLGFSDFSSFFWIHLSLGFWCCSVRASPARNFGRTIYWIEINIWISFSRTCFVVASLR